MARLPGGLPVAIGLHAVCLQRMPPNNSLGSVLFCDSCYSAQRFFLSLPDTPPSKLANLNHCFGIINAVSRYCSPWVVSPLDGGAKL